MPLFLIKINNALHFAIFLIIDFLIKRKPNKINPNTLLLIRLDSIGDYILVRNFLKTFREKGKFQNYKITLCGNILWKEIAEEFDKDIINDFLWIERKYFYDSPVYRHKFLKDIYEKGFEVAIDMTFTRELLYGDSIIKTSNAKIKVGSEGSLEKHTSWKRKLLTNKYYTKLIPASHDNLFEFLRNKIFFERLLDVKIDLNKPTLPKSIVTPFFSFNKKYAVLFPGATSLLRRWKQHNFSEILKYIIQRYDFVVVIAGGENETQIAETLISGINDFDAINMVGKTSLPQLIDLIRNAEILISNDTGATHIAVSVDTPFVCVSNGNHFGRFHPYPQEIYDKAYYIYPPEIMNNLDDIELLKNKYRFSSDLDINEIKPQVVKEVIKKVLG